jgi:hypothetical protein
MHNERRKCNKMIAYKDQEELRIHADLQFRK